MCGRYVLKREALKAIAKQFGLRDSDEYRSRYNIAPTSIVPLLRSREAGKPELAAVRWGLIPAWTRADGPVRPLVNIRAESLTGKLSGVLRSGRCVLPASGFYEWEQSGSRKQPWYFSRRDEEPFGLAGIWDTWRSDDGMTLESCAIVTTTPNAVLKPIHTRMPVMLTVEQCQAWLDGSASSPAVANKLLAPAPDADTVAKRVGPAVSNVRNDGPECLEPATDEPGEAEPQLSLGL